MILRKTKLAFLVSAIAMFALSGCSGLSATSERLTAEVQQSSNETTVYETVKPTEKETVKPTEKETVKPTEKETVKPTTAPETTTAKETEEETTVEPTTEVEDTYENNSYYDIVEVQTYSDSIGYTHIVHKVQAKKSISVDATLLAFDADGNVIGKSTDDITLSEGKMNFFHYSFKSDISNASIQASAKTKEISSFMTGDMDAVEMTGYNLVDASLYITFKQVKENLGGFSKFKLLIYKGDNLVKVEDGYFRVYAKNLDGIDSIDVASLWAYKLDCDRIEYVFEP